MEGLRLPRGRVLGLFDLGLRLQCSLNRADRWGRPSALLTASQPRPPLSEQENSSRLSVSSHIHHSWPRHPWVKEGDKTR